MNADRCFREFLDSYIATALWSTNDESDESGGEPLDKNYSRDDIAPECMDRMTADCQSFFDANASDISEIPDKTCSDGWWSGYSLAGHDFWLSRNRHGAGFFDREYLTKRTRNKLQSRAEKFGEVNLYVGDDKQIHHS